MNQKFDISLYNEDFFLWHVKYARQYSMLIMKELVKKYRYESVVDFGCGIGSYLEMAYEMGIGISGEGLCGYEISVDALKYAPLSIMDTIVIKDITKRIVPQQKYECVLSFETAEHVQPEGSEQLVKNLIQAASKHILFTAAPPGQEGCGHINCQPREYWLELFRKNGVEEDKELTEQLKSDWRKIPGVPDYMVNNLIAFSV